VVHVVKREQNDLQSLQSDLSEGEFTFEEFNTKNVCQDKEVYKKFSTLVETIKLA
jgi:hypothetical protein